MIIRLYRVVLGFIRVETWIVYGSYKSNMDIMLSPSFTVNKLFQFADYLLSLGL